MYTMTDIVKFCAFSTQLMKTVSFSTVMLYILYNIQKQKMKMHLQAKMSPIVLSDVGLFSFKTYE